MKKVIILGIILTFGFLDFHAMEERNFLDIEPKDEYEFKSNVPQNTTQEGDLEPIKRGYLFYVVEKRKKEKNKVRNCSCLKECDDSKYCG